MNKDKIRVILSAINYKLGLMNKELYHFLFEDYKFLFTVYGLIFAIGSIYYLSNYFILSREAKEGSILIGVLGIIVPIYICYRRISKG